MRARFFLLLLIMGIVTGCASTTVTNRDEIVTGPLPRPATIWVNDFAATPADLPAYSTLAGQYTLPDQPQTAEHIAAGRKLGAQMQSELVDNIIGMGLPAKKAGAGTAKQTNDIVLQGYIMSFSQGSEAERVGIGFGSGNTDLKVAMEGFQMTAGGLRKLGSGSTDAEGNKTPGAAAGGAMFLITHNPVGLIVSTGLKAYGEESGSDKVEGRAKQTAKQIADGLKQRFQQQGWIR